MGINRNLPCVPWLNGALGVAIYCAFAGLSVTATAGEPDIVVEDDDVVVVADDEGLVVTEEATGTAWKALAVEPRKVGGETAYIRQSTDAFADPDKPLALEPNYYFVLDEVPWTAAGYLEREDLTASEETIRLGRRARKLSFADAFPLPKNINQVDGDLHVQWLDMKVGPLATRRVLAALYVPQSATQAELAVLRARSDGNGWKVEKIAASRSIPAERVRIDVPTSSLLDTYNPPDDLGGARVFFSKIIAVLTRFEGRYAVEFHGDTLRDSGVCRVLLTADDHPLGRPVAIRFIELPIAREDDRVVPATVLAVAYGNTDGERAAIAIDYPLASTPLMAQMRQLLLRENKRGGEDDSEDRLTKMLGVDLADELSRRLVDALY